MNASFGQKTFVRKVCERIKQSTNARRSKIQVLDTAQIEHTRSENLLPGKITQLPTKMDIDLDNAMNSV